MAAEWWWFLVLNAIVAAVAVLSKVRPPSSPRGGGGVTRRTSSAVLQHLRSSIFSFPSACLHTVPAPLPQAEPEPEPVAIVSQETEEPAEEAPPAKPAASPPRSLACTTPPPAPPAKAEEREKKDDDPNAMSMEEAYAQIMARSQRPESEREEETRRSNVDAKAEEFIQGFKEDLRQQRLNSIFNYTQMLKKRAVGDGHRQPDAQADQPR